MALTAETIAGFSASLLQKSFDGAVETPQCHMEWWKMFCYPHPQVAIAAPVGTLKQLQLPKLVHWLLSVSVNGNT